MEEQSYKPVLFTQRGLELTTKGIAIYALFNVVIVAVKVIQDKINMSVLVPPQMQYPMLALLTAYLFISAVTVYSVWKKKYSWILVVLSLVILIICRFYYIPIANWIYGLVA